MVGAPQACPLDHATQAGPDRSSVRITLALQCGSEHKGSVEQACRARDLCSKPAYEHLRFDAGPSGSPSATFLTSSLPQLRRSLPARQGGPPRPLHAPARPPSSCRLTPRGWVPEPWTRCGQRCQTCVRSTAHGTHADTRPSQPQAPNLRLPKHKARGSAERVLARASTRIHARTKLTSSPLRAACLSAPPTWTWACPPMTPWP